MKRFQEISNKANPVFNDDDIKSMENTVDKFQAQETDVRRPGMIFGHIQSGKTRNYIGVIAKALDEGFDYIVILTKGTKMLEKQTAKRVNNAFRVFDEIDDVAVYNLAEAERDFTKYELEQKLIFVVKKERNNLNTLINKFTEPKFTEIFKRKNVLLLDDEADFASVGYKNSKEAMEANRTQQQISDMRKLFNSYSFLQVTATPYSLYLQPESIDLPSGINYEPVKPAFTTLVPPGKGYVGGEIYFKESLDEENLSHYFNINVDPSEYEILKEEDRRSFKIDNILEEKSIKGFRLAIISFIVGGLIRRFQQKKLGQKIEKYTFLVHTDMKKKSHEWQSVIVKSLFLKLTTSIERDIGNYRELISQSYDDLLPSLKLTNLEIPSYKEVEELFCDAITDEYYKTVIVNSDEKEIEALTDESGELSRDVPFTIFVGGQILDRGITVPALLGFYYGRTPKTSQQDTVLQHARMYGYRDKDDLAVTRLYTSPYLHQKMKWIYEADALLREAIENGTDEKIIFLSKDSKYNIRPCSPGKVKLRNQVTLKPFKRILPIGFQTEHKQYRIEAVNKDIDLIIDSIFFGNYDSPKLVEFEIIEKIVNLISKTLFLEKEEGYSFNWEQSIAISKYLSSASVDNINSEKLWLSIHKDRNISRKAKETSHVKYSDAPDSKTERIIAKEFAIENPILFLLEQMGSKDDGWKGHRFFWPVLMAQSNIQNVIFTPELIE